MSTDFAAINAARIHYQLCGHGAPVALVHAGIADLRMWDAVVPALARRHRVLRHDLRGFGQSAPVPGEFSHRGDLSALLDRLGIERTAVVGASLGGRIAIDLALAHPERVSAVVLLASTPAGFEAAAFPPPRQQDEISRAFAARDFYRCSALETEVWLVGPRRRAEEVGPALRARVEAMNRIALENEARGIGTEQPPEPTFDRLGEVRCPALIGIGALDQPHVIAAGEAAAARIPGAQKHVFATAHLPAMEQPEECARVLLEFLAVAS